MSRRTSLPGAAELFRRTADSPYPDHVVDSPTEAGAEANDNGTGSRAETARRLAAGQLAKAAEPRGGSGRRKHDAKITVYVSGAELLALEQTRVTLRGAHDLVVDRGRIVREAVAVLLADFEDNGENSVLVQRLRGERSGPADNVSPA